MTSKNWDKISLKLKKIWDEEAVKDNPHYYHPYLLSLPKKLFLKSAYHFNTPQYLLDKEELRKRLHFFKDTFKKEIKNVGFFYACKCNDSIAVLGTIKEEGYYLDVAGIFELKLALKMGFEKIIFTSPSKSVDELRLSIKHGKKVILNADNKQEIIDIINLVKQNRISTKIQISLRMRNHDSDVWSKYGLELDEIKQILSIIRKNKRLSLVGFHVHHSGNKNSERYIKNIVFFSKVLSMLSKKEREKLIFLNLGGGFYPESLATINLARGKGLLLNLIEKSLDDPLIYKKTGYPPFSFRVEHVDPLPKFSKDIGLALKQHIFKLAPDLTIFFEPGQFLVTHSTSILLKVTSIKGNKVFVDGGVNLIGDDRFTKSSFAPIVNLSNFSLNFNSDKVIYGPLCYPLDLWGYSYYGENIRVGDILAVLHQGAYTYSCAWRFIKPIAKYVTLDKAKFNKQQLVLSLPEEKIENRYYG